MAPNAKIPTSLMGAFAKKKKKKKSAIGRTFVLLHYCWRGGSIAVSECTPPVHYGMVRLLLEGKCHKH